MLPIGFSASCVPFQGYSQRRPDTKPSGPIPPSRTNNVLFGTDAWRRRGLHGKPSPDFVPTPPGLATEMVQLAGIRANMSVLEPSAGMGNLADVIKKVGRVKPFVIEADPQLREILIDKRYQIIAHDFLTYSRRYFDAIVMNPPFSNGQPMAHVRHAVNLLYPGGTVVSVMPAYILQSGGRSGVKNREFTNWLAELERKHYTVEWRDVDPNVFINEDSSVQVETKLLKIKKPEGLPRRS